MICRTNGGTRRTSAGGIGQRFHGQKVARAATSVVRTDTTYVGQKATTAMQQFTRQYGIVGVHFSEYCERECRRRGQKVETRLELSRVEFNSRSPWTNSTIKTMEKGIDCTRNRGADCI
jgi:hypothetical protein